MVGALLYEYLQGKDLKEIFYKFSLSNSLIFTKDEVGQIDAYFFRLQIPLKLKPDIIVPLFKNNFVA